MPDIGRQRHRNPQLVDREEVIAEHQRIGSLLAQLERPANPTRFPLMLDGLRYLLRHHFDREQAPDGLYDFLQARHPAQRDQLQSLRGQHRSLLDDLTRLAQRSRRGADPQLLVDVAGFCQRLREHERRESRLLVDAAAFVGRGPARRDAPPSR